MCVSQCARCVQACAKFLEKLLIECPDHPGVYGLLHWGPLLGWGWMTGKPFHTGWGYCAPDIDTKAGHNGDWGKIGWDAINGIKACALSLGAVFTVCWPQHTQSPKHAPLRDPLDYPLPSLASMSQCRLRKLSPPPGHVFHLAQLQRPKKEVNLEMLYVAPKRLELSVVGLLSVAVRTVDNTCVAMCGTFLAGQFSRPRTGVVRGKPRAEGVLLGQRPHARCLHCLRTPCFACNQRHLCACPHVG